MLRIAQHTIRTPLSIHLQDDATYISAIKPTRALLNDSVIETTLLFYQAHVRRQPGCTRAPAPVRPRVSGIGQIGFRARPVRGRMRALRNEDASIGG